MFGRVNTSTLRAGTPDSAGSLKPHGDSWPGEGGRFFEPPPSSFDHLIGSFLSVIPGISTFTEAIVQFAVQEFLSASPRGSS
jgi:hypothetical protein